MTITIWERLKAEASAFPMMFAGGVSEAEIDQAETELRCIFDPAYKKFLRVFGGAMVGSEPVLGLRQAEVMGVDSWSVVDVTRRFRKDGWPGVQDWYIVSMDGAGNPIGVSPDGHVFHSDHHGGGVTKIADDFESFLSTTLYNGRSG